MRELVPVTDNLIYKYQSRKAQASSRLSQFDISSADFETIDGDAWLFTLAWYKQNQDEIELCSDLVEYSDDIPFNIGEFYLWISERVGSYWRRGGGVKGVSHPYLFFYNIHFDCQTIIKTFQDSAIDKILDDTNCVINVDTHELVEVERTGWNWKLTPHQKKMRLMEISYLPRKYFRMKPLGSFKNFTDSKGYRRRYGPVDMFDIAQFYSKSLADASTDAMKEGLVDFKKMDTIDTSKINDESYRLENYEEIKKYALVDSEITLMLSWIKIQEFENQGVRMVNPYSVASISERSMLDNCDIPTLNDMVKVSRKKKILNYCWSSYRGGWFETTGAGFQEDCRLFDLTSAYPYVMYWLPDYSQGYWSEGDRSNVHLFNQWLLQRQPYWLGSAEAIVIFPEGLNIYPALAHSKFNCAVTPRKLKGWFSGDELSEFKKWGAKITIYRWCCHYPKPDAGYPLRPFIEKWYSIKYEQGLKKNTPDFDKAAYTVAKCAINSGYGKVIATVEDKKTKKLKIGKIFSPAWGSVITGGTRARMAEFVRLNNPDNILATATDGIIMKNHDSIVIPEIPMPACYDLGEWDEETYDDGRTGQVDVLIMMSGVYSARAKNGTGKTKTSYRGNPALFIGREDQPENWFDFCEINSDLSKISRDEHNHPNSRPYSLAEARIQGDYSLTNQFRVVKATIRALGDSNKRRWPDTTPKTFNDLRTNYFKSYPHQVLP